jgi:primosomal protein N''
MGKNVTVVFYYDENSDDDESSQFISDSLAAEASFLKQILTTQEVRVPEYLTQRVLEMGKKEMI